jgi:hypothetical protein
MATSSQKTKKGILERPRPRKKLEAVEPQLISSSSHRAGPRLALNVVSVVGIVGAAG